MLRHNQIDDLALENRSQFHRAVVDNAKKRAMLFELDNNIQSLKSRYGESEEAALQNTTVIMGLPFSFVIFFVGSRAARPVCGQDFRLLEPFRNPARSIIDTIPTIIVSTVANPDWSVPFNLSTR